MAKGQEAKTNAVREVEASGLSHQIFTWECPEAMGGLEVAQRLGQDPERVFKTLVTRGKSGEHYVFLVPVVCSLNLKKAAHAVGEKSIEMIKDRELLPLTAYIHGGCSPIGMKKQFTTMVDETAQVARYSWPRMTWPNWCLWSMRISLPDRFVVQSSASLFFWSSAACEQRRELQDGAVSSGPL